MEVRRHHLVVHLVGCVGRSAIGLLFLFLIIATVEIGGAFVLVGTAMVLVSGDEISHVRRRVLVELLVVAKDEDGDVDGAEDGQLVGLLEQTALSLQEGDRTISVILDGFDLNLSSPHGDGLWVSWIDGLLAVASPRGARGTEWRRRRQGRGGMEVDSV